MTALYCYTCGEYTEHAHGICQKQDHGTCSECARLRAEVEEKHRLNMEYANEVLGLRAEVERLREALREIDRVYTPNGNLARDIQAALAPRTRCYKT